MSLTVNRINEVFGGEAYLITSDKGAVLIDSGYAVKVDDTIKNIEKYLGNRKLSAIILTHSHYDHVMGTPAIKEHFPQAKIYAHPRVRRIFSKENARKTMEDMNSAAADERGLTAEYGWADKLHVDVDVEDEDIIKAGDMTIKVIETPGHTKCSISLLFEDDNLLVASESLGVPLDFPGVVPGFIVSYDDAINSIKRVQGLNPDSILLPHSRVVSGEDVHTYLDNALTEAQRIFEIVSHDYKKGHSTEQIVERLKDIYYKGNFKKFQPDKAFYANWIPLVNKIIQSLPA